MKHLVGYSLLFLILLSRICVVTVNYKCGIYKLALAVLVIKMCHVLVMIVWKRLTVLLLRACKGFWLFVKWLFVRKEATK